MIFIAVGSPVDRLELVYGLGTTRVGEERVLLQLEVGERGDMGAGERGDGGVTEMGDVGVRREKNLPLTDGGFAGLTNDPKLILLLC